MNVNLQKKKKRGVWMNGHKNWSNGMKFEEIDKNSRNWRNQKCTVLLKESVIRTPKYSLPLSLSISLSPSCPPNINTYIWCTTQSIINFLLLNNNPSTNYLLSFFYKRKKIFIKKGGVRHPPTLNYTFCSQYKGTVEQRLKSFQVLIPTK